DREALTGPGVAVGAPTVRIDDERFRAVRYGDVRDMREPAAGPIAQAENFDLLLGRLGNPHLARQGDGANVVRGRCELDRPDDRARFRAHELERLRPPIRSDDPPNG